MNDVSRNSQAPLNYKTIEGIVTNILSENGSGIKGIRIRPYDSQRGLENVAKLEKSGFFDRYFSVDFLLTSGSLNLGSSVIVDYSEEQKEMHPILKISVKGEKGYIQYSGFPLVPSDAEDHVENYS